MTATEFAKEELDNVGYMLEQAFEGIDDKTLDLRTSSKSMTAREMAEHLSECYQAVITTSRGEKYEWGSFRAADKSWPALGNEMKAMRAKAVLTCLDGTDEALRRAKDYLISHDNYHVGQLCLIRLEADENWDAYSIYQFEE